LDAAWATLVEIIITCTIAHHAARLLPLAYMKVFDILKWMANRLKLLSAMVRILEFDVWYLMSDQENVLVLQSLYTHVRQQVIKITSIISYFAVSDYMRSI